MVAKIIGSYAYLIEALAAIPEGDGTLLDNTILVGTSEISLGRSHSLENLPLLIAGGGGAPLKSVSTTTQRAESTSAALPA